MAVNRNPLHRFLLQRNWGACDTISQVNLLTPHPHFSVDRGAFKSPRTDLSHEILFGGAKAGVSPRKNCRIREAHFNNICAAFIFLPLPPNSPCSVLKIIITFDFYYVLL